jgi:5-methylcytosine-specific restriction enzyme B
MNTQEANDIVERLRSAQRAGAPVEELHGEDARRFGFFADRQLILGSFAVRAPGMLKFFVSVVSKSNPDDGFQFFVMERLRAPPVLGSSFVSRDAVRWRYTPAKQSGDNAARKRAFIEATGSDTIDIPLPSDDIVPFASTVVRAITLRRSADAIEEDDSDHLDDSDDPPVPVAAKPVVWKVAPGERGHDWERCKTSGFIGLGWEALGDLRGIDRATFDARVVQAGYTPGAEAAWKFKDIRVGDRIVANAGTKTVLGIGTVIGPYSFVADEPYGHRLAVRWDDVTERVVDQYGWRQTLTRISDETFAKIKTAPPRDAASEAADDDGDEPSAVGAPAVSFTQLLDQLAQRSLVFSPEIVASFLLALQARRFVLLTGISGTGKTQLALEVARILSPGVDVNDDDDDDDTVEIVIKPYQRKYSRFVVPARLARRLDVLRDSAQKQLDVRIADGRVDALTVGKSSDNRNLLEVFLSGESRSTFLRTFALNDRARLKIERRGDRELLAVERVDVSPRAALAAAATHELVAVRPDWTDARALLGFYNPLTCAYVSTPTLELLLRARAEHTRATSTGTSPRPFFLIFDEMNLARVEHYFSDFLSAMESGEPIHLHDDDDLAADDETPIPRRLAVAPNVFVVGTVNVDETTYMFSPKVLDRAFVLEFNHVDLDALGGGPVSTKASSPLALTRLESELRARGPHEDHEWQRFSALLDGALATRLRSIHAALASEHRHFGYRVAREIARFVDLANEQTDGSPEALRAAFDVAVLSKVLPKLNGGQAELESVLQRLFVLACGDGDGADAVSGDAPVDFTAYSASTNGLVRRDGALVEMPRTAPKLWRMLRRLRAHGFAGFIE